MWIKKVRIMYGQTGCCHCIFFSILHNFSHWGLSSLSLFGCSIIVEKIYNGIHLAICRIFLIFIEIERILWFTRLLLFLAAFIRLFHFRFFFYFLRFNLLLSYFLFLSNQLFNNIQLNFFLNLWYFLLCFFFLKTGWCYFW